MIGAQIFCSRFVRRSDMYIRGYFQKRETGLKDDDLEEGDWLDEITEMGTRQGLDEEYVEHKEFTTGKTVTLKKPAPVSPEKPLPVTDGPSPNDLAKHRWWVPLLKAGEQADLLRDAKSGSKAAKDKLFQHH